MGNETGTEQEEQKSKGRGWFGDPEGHSKAGQIGGAKIAEDREHMSEIGSKGGRSVSRNTQHMAEIGRRGGSNRGKAGTK